MRKVKFNVTTSVHMIPENIYQELIDKLHHMKFNDYKAFQQRILAGTEYQMLDVKEGDIVEVPDWYYEAHKKDTLTIGNSFEHYKDAQGNLTPFNTAEAVRHGDMKDSKQTVKTVLRFEAVEKESEQKSRK